MSRLIVEYLPNISDINKSWIRANVSPSMTSDDSAQYPMVELKELLEVEVITNPELRLFLTFISGLYFDRVDYIEF